MNLREWKTDNAKVELSAASNVIKESNSKWSARYDLKAEYQKTALEKVIDDGSYRLATSLDERMAVSASASGCSLSRGGRGARLRARPRNGALPHIVGRQAAHRVRQRRRARRPGRVGLPAVARVAVRARLHGDVFDGPGARRPLRLQGRGQPRVAPRGQRQRGAGVDAVN